MSTGSNIEWTEATWNPVVGCTRVSAGCDHCYAVQMTHRLEKMGQAKYAGLTVLNKQGDRHFNGRVRCVEEALEAPLKWRKPRRIFVNSMSDLFHRDVPFEFIDRVLAVMALCPQHTFQILTKRPERMAEYLAMPWAEDGGRWLRAVGPLPGECLHMPMLDIRSPLPNVWIGTSCEDQAAADERIPHLLRCPAAVRFISAEPLLGPIDLEQAVTRGCPNGGKCDIDGSTGHRVIPDSTEGGMFIECACSRFGGIDWVIVGGESGGGARACSVEWIRSIVQQCGAAGVACFVKQLGALVREEIPHDDGLPARAIKLARQHGIGSLVTEVIEGRLRDPKGGDPSEWPEDLRVREWPAQKVGAA